MRRMTDRGATPLAKCFQSVVVGVLALGNSLWAADRQSAFLDAQTLHDAWEANYAHIQSVKFRMTQRVVSASGPGTERMVPVSHWEVIRDGMRVYGRQSPSEEGFTEGSWTVVASFDGSIGKIYRVWRKEAEIHQGLSGHSIESYNPIEGCMLAERMRLSNSPARRQGPYQGVINKLVEEFPEGCPLLTMEFRLAREEGKLRVLPRLEEVAGKMCHVLEMGNYEKGFGQRCWLAHDCGMLVMHYVAKAPNDHMKEMQVQQVDKIETEVGTVWYPVVATWDVKNPGGRTFKQELKVSEYVPHIKVSPDAFDMNFPPGTRVHDKIANVVYVQEPGPTVAVPTLSDAADPLGDGATRGKDGALRDSQKHEVSQDREMSEKAPVLGDSVTKTQMNQGNSRAKLLVVSLVIAAGLAALVLWAGPGKRYRQARTRSHDE